MGEASALSHGTNSEEVPVQDLLSLYLLMAPSPERQLRPEEESHVAKDP